MSSCARCGRDFELADKVLEVRVVSWLYEDGSIRADRPKPSEHVHAEACVPLARGGVVPRPPGGWQERVWALFEGGCYIPLSQRPRDEIMDQAMELMRQPVSPGKLVMPTVMWTDDERDTPKMIVETLSVVQTAMSIYAFHSEVSPSYLEPHNARIARLLEAAERGVQ